MHGSPTPEDAHPCELIEVTTTNAARVAKIGRIIVGSLPGIGCGSAWVARSTKRARYTTGWRKLIEWVEMRQARRDVCVLPKPLCCRLVPWPQPFISVSLGRPRQPLGTSDLSP